MQLPHILLIINSAAPKHKMMKSEQISTDSNELKYKGVRKRKWGKYVSEVRLPNSRDRIWLGSYDTAEKAARAFDAALFCLRGPYAKFNFPDDPPNIPGSQALTPAQIQVVAQHYGNTYAGGQQLPPEVGPRPDEFEEASPSSNSIDWSFLDVLDSGMAGNSGHVSDFGLFFEPADNDMYVPPHLNEDYDNENGGNNNAASFLWSF